METDWKQVCEGFCGGRGGGDAAPQVSKASLSEMPQNNVMFHLCDQRCDAWME